MSQRIRSGRGSARNTTAPHGEEINLWESCREKINEAINQVNNDNSNLKKILDLDAKAAEEVKKDSQPTYKTLHEMEDLCGAGVRQEEAVSANIKNLIEQLGILKALQGEQNMQTDVDMKHSLSRGSASRTRDRENRERERADKDRAEKDRADKDRDSKDSGASANIYDFDIVGGSPAPSASGPASRRHERAERNSQRERDSAPPDEGTPAPDSKAARTKPHVFARGDSVAFRPKPPPGEGPQDWILGEVKAVMGEGKSRRYKVLDAEPEDSSLQKEYRTGASSMIPISADGVRLPVWESGKKVLAMYPATTTFYPAEVIGEEDGKVNLRFDGENDVTTMQQVERRYVVEFRA